MAKRNCSNLSFGGQLVLEEERHLDGQLCPGLGGAQRGLQEVGSGLWVVVGKLDGVDPARPERQSRLRLEVVEVAQENPSAGEEWIDLLSGEEELLLPHLQRPCQRKRFKLEAMSKNTVKTMAIT